MIVPHYTYTKLENTAKSYFNCGCPYATCHSSIVMLFQALKNRKPTPKNQPGTIHPKGPNPKPLNPKALRLLCFLES